MFEIERQFTKLATEEYPATLHRVRTLEEYEPEYIGAYRNYEGGLEFEEIFNGSGEENLYKFEYFENGKWEEIETLKGYENTMNYIKEWETTTDEWGI